MTLISFLDLLAVSCLLAALVLLLSRRAAGQSPLRFGMFALVGTYLLNSAPNFVEWFGYPNLVEPFEEYVQVLLPAAFFVCLSLACHTEEVRTSSARNRVFRALHTVTENVPSDLDPEALWRELLLRVIRETGFDGGFVDLPDQARLIDVKVEWKGFGDFARQVEDIDVEDTLLNQVLMSRRPMVVRRTADVPDHLVQALSMSGVRSAAFFPVCSESRVLGVMGVVSQEEYRFAPEEVDLFALLGNHLGEIMGNSLLLEEARERAKSLKSALDARTYFLQIVTEDLHEPLGRLQLMVGKLAERAAGNPEVSTMVEQAKEDATSLQRLLNDVRELAFLEAPDSPILFAPIDPCREVPLVLESLADRARRKEVSLEASIPEACAPLEADRDLFRSAVRHLVANAVKYTPGGGRVHVTVEEEAERFYLQVRDTGIGVEEEAADRVFDMFYRAPRARDFAPTGTGLGLTIVRQIALLHGGDVTFTSNPGRGSTFVLVLPRLHLE